MSPNLRIASNLRQKHQTETQPLLKNSYFYPMRGWLLVLVCGLWSLGCDSPASKAAAYPDSPDTAAYAALPTADASPCEAIDKKLPLLSFPYRAAPESAQAREPFPPPLQAWLREKLASDEDKEPLYSPIGQLRYPDGTTLWLIEAIDASRQSLYALLIDKGCTLHDRFTAALQKGTTHQLSFGRFIFFPVGTITMEEESHHTSPDPQTGELRFESAKAQKRYRVDFERRRFVAL